MPARTTRLVFSLTSPVKKRLGARIEQGYRLACQLWLTHDVELSQEAMPLADVVAPAGAAVGRP